jgi:hypothetical protein
MKRLLFLTLLLTVACTPGMPIRHKRYLLKEAVNDLECKKSKISLKNIGKNRYRAWGCNIKASYSIECKDDGKCDTTMIEVPRPIKTGR